MRKLKNIKSFILILILLSVSLNNIHAQSRYNIPNVTNPNLPNSNLFPYSLYQSLQSEYVTKTTKSFELKGAVKSIKETIYAVNKPKSTLQTIEYSFLENGKLLSYEEDTLNSFKNSYSKIEQYTYDSRNNHLLKAQYLDGTPGLNSTKTIFFDADGYVIKEEFKKIQTHNYEPMENVFDYILSYEWDKNKDTVNLKYSYKIERSSYERHRNITYSLVSEKKQLKENKDRIPTGKEELFLFDLLEKSYEYDSIGNLLKYYSYDNSIKGSFNIHQLYEYKYNQDNQLIEVKYSSTGPSPEFVLQYKHDITYLKYDKHGNWTSRKVSDYIYKRSLLYY